MIEMRVAILTNFIPPYRLPFLKLISEKVKDLQIYVSTPMEPNRPWPPDWEGLKVQIQNTITINRTWRHPGGFSEIIYVHIPYDTLSILQKYRPDIVVSAELGFRSIQSAIYSLIHRNCKLILWCTLSERSEQGRGRIRGILRKWLLPRADAVLVNGESGARYVKQFGVPESRIFRIGQTPPIENFTRVPLEQLGSNVTRLLIVGSLNDRKGILPFMDLLCNWSKAHPNEKVELICAGEGPLYDQLTNQDLPSNLKLHLMGNARYEDMPAIYSSADILAFPTLADEWGLVVNEAMAVGLPVLGSLYSQAVEELVTDGETGWTFRPDRMEEMARAIDRALSVEPVELSKMRLAARKKALMNTPSVMTDKFLQAIEYTLG